MPGKTIADFLAGKSPHTIELFNHFTATFNSVGIIELHAAKTMIGISNSHKRIAWITQFGKNFIHVVFPFKHFTTIIYALQKLRRCPAIVNSSIIISECYIPPM